MRHKPELVLALDVDGLQKAGDFLDKLYPRIKIFKVGSQLFTACGPEIIRLIRNKGAEVFLDLKYFDIPQVVAAAVRQATRQQVKMLTLHILGDEEMLKSALKAGQEEAAILKVERPLLFGVTVLTSKETTASDVLTLARIGIESGLDGVVCSAKEAVMLRKEIKRDFLIITPGIRAKGTALADQKRVVTAEEAIQAGSDFLVVGRPILQAEEPLEAVKIIQQAWKTSRSK
jgi:orotidine-5'-phosphate decarboxylase